MPQFDGFYGFMTLAVVAPFIGSFLGTLALRLPANRSVVSGRSHCDHCGHTLGARDLIPILSWLLSGGKCRYCGARLSIFYPAIELAALGVVLLCASVVTGWILVTISLIGWTMLALAAAWLVRPLLISSSGSNKDVQDRR